MSTSNRANATIRKIDADTYFEAIDFVNRINFLFDRWEPRQLLEAFSEDVIVDHGCHSFPAERSGVTTKRFDARNRGAAQLPVDIGFEYLVVQVQAVPAPEKAGKCAWRVAVHADVMSSPLHSASPCITAAMRAASRRLTLLYDEVMAPSGLRVTQYHILSELERRTSEPPTVSELAEILTMERSALGQTFRPRERDGFIALGRDERDGFIALGRDERDGRRRPVQLRPAGKDAVAWGRRYWAKAHERFQRFFGDTALAALRTTLREIAENRGLSDVFQTDARPN
jgi:DNA-binding MarR family transcriptional regulator